MPKDNIACEQTVRKQNTPPPLLYCLPKGGNILVILSTDWSV